MKIRRWQTIHVSKLSSEICSNMVKYYYNGKLFTGICIDYGGMKCYFKNGLLHREDGPAVGKNWWIKGKPFNFILKISKTKKFARFNQK